MATKQPKWTKAFIKALIVHGGVTRAAKEAEVSRSVVYDRRDKDVDFNKAWEEALDCYADDLEIEARRRAVDGIVVEEVYEDDKLIRKKLKYSDTLLIFLLKGARPEKFADHSKVEHSGAIQNETDEMLDARIAKLFSEAGVNSADGGEEATPKAP